MKSDLHDSPFFLFECKFLIPISCLECSENYRRLSKAETKLFGYIFIIRQAGWVWVAVYWFKCMWTWNFLGIVSWCMVAWWLNVGEIFSSQKRCKNLIYVCKYRTEFNYAIRVQFISRDLHTPQKAISSSTSYPGSFHYSLGTRLLVVNPTKIAFNPRLNLIVYTVWHLYILNNYSQLLFVILVFARYIIFWVGKFVS